MAFEEIILKQLLFRQPTLGEEVVQILTHSKEPLSVSDIYQLSNVALTSRDISLLLSQRRDKLNIEISHYAKRPGFRQCAHYKMKETK